MSLNLSERYVIALNFLLVSVLAYFAAMTASDLLMRKFASEPGVLRSAPLSGKPSTADHPRAYYNTIIERDIFNLPKNGVATVAPTVTQADLHMKLLGTSLLTMARPFAVVEDDSSRQQSLYRLDDEIPNAGKLVAVEKDRILINHNGQIVALEIPREAMLAAPALAAPRPGGAGPGTQGAEEGIRKTGDNQYVVDRRMVDQNLQNMAQLFTQMRAVPIIENGKTNGFRLSEIQPGSLFNQMGLADGDVIKSIGGQEMNDPSRAMEMLPMLRTQRSLTIDVIRGGRPIQLSFEIR